jgi:hypothetical protein
LPRESGSFRADHPDEAGWGLNELLLAAAVDALHGANWQRGGDRRASRPKRIPRPGVRDDAGTKTFGKPAGKTADEMRDFLRRWGSGELADQYQNSTLDL